MLDIDGNNATDATTDGLLVIRYMFAMRGQGLVQDTIGAGATRNAAQIESYLASQLSNFDIDGNGTSEALTDGLLVLRYLFNIRGAALIQGVIGAGATRTTATQIEAYLATLTSGGGAQTAPSGCTVSASPSTSYTNRVQPGTGVQLSANCTVGTQPITYTWHDTATGATRTVNPTTTNSYSVVGSNGAGTSQTQQVTVFVDSPPTGIGFCTAADDRYDVTWPATQAKFGTFGMTNQIVSFKIVVPLSFNPPISPTALGSGYTAEVPGRPRVQREITVSTSPCDFQSGNYIWTDIGTHDGAGFLFTVNNPSGYAAAGANLNLQPGQTVYVNIRNYVSDNGTNVNASCPAGKECDLYFGFDPP
jgi:hypothetical protein